MRATLARASSEGCDNPPRERALTTGADLDGMGTETMLRAGLVGLAAAALLLTACGDADDESQTNPTPTTSTSTSPAPSTISPRKLAVANLLLTQDVTPAPPGSIANAAAPVTPTGTIGEPSRQVMTCTPLELPGEGDVGPAEPDAKGAAWSNAVMGVAQIDQYVVVYSDDAAAQRAVDRSRARAEDCDAAFAVHSPDAEAEATVSAAPDAVAGFRVHTTYQYPNSKSDEVSAVLQHGTTVLYIRAAESGSGENSEEDVDGILDPAWADELILAASTHLAS